MKPLSPDPSADAAALGRRSVALHSQKSALVWLQQESSGIPVAGVAADDEVGAHLRFT